MKRLNLIPKERRLRGFLMKFRLVAGIVVMVPVVVYGYGYMALEDLKSELVTVDAEVSKGIQVESSIKSIEDRIKGLDSVVAQLSEKSVPLNHFLKFMGDELPDTMKIHSIVSESIVVERLRDGETSEGLPVDRSSSELIEYISEGGYNGETNSAVDAEGEVGANSNEENVSGGGNAAGASSAGVVGDNGQSGDGVGGESVPENRDTEDVNTNPLVEGVQSSNIGEGDKTENLNRSKDLIIRGYSTSVSDLGHFMSRLKDEAYVLGVEVSEVVDYYNGLSNYKFFELHVIIGDASDVVKDE